ncbi:hypothetical protein AAC691_18435 [Nguyenibacter vanlangensis]|uniref:Uncharacterized protein n=1 Tax=Nguyenibacter vanlangensis TaxID=1216886 RepID=A0ABZ3D3N7_9PROT
MSDLAGSAAAQPIIAVINANGGVGRQNKDRLFELRFAYALHRAGLVPTYEVPGEGAATIDFGFANRGQEWAVELLRLGETRAAAAATTQTVDEHGVAWSGRLLSTTADDRRAACRILPITSASRQRQLPTPVKKSTRARPAW